MSHCRTCTHHPRDITDNKNYNSQVQAYAQARRISREAKRVALSENSFIAYPNKMAKDGAWWNWFLTWNDGKAGVGGSDPNNFWTGEYYSTDAHKRSVYQHPMVITLDELPRFLTGFNRRQATDSAVEAQNCRPSSLAGKTRTE